MPFPHPAIAAATRPKLDEADLDRRAEEEFLVKHSQPLGRRPDASDHEDAKIQNFLERVGLYGTPRAKVVDVAPAPDTMAWPRETRLHPTPSHFDPEVRLTGSDYVEPVGQKEWGPQTAATEEYRWQRVPVPRDRQVEFWEGCEFTGPPPVGYRSWQAWCASYRKTGVALRALETP